MRKVYKFFFPKKTARIFLRPTFSNIIMTLTDLNNKIVICKTSGASGLLGSKRRKKAPRAIETIFQAILPYLKLHRIQNIQIVLKMRIKAHFYILLKELQYNGLNITSYIIRRKIAFTAFVVEN